MQITFKQKEIELALALYITKNGISLEGKTVSIAFTAGRGAAGLTAEVDIEDAALVSLASAVSAAVPKAPEVPLVNTTTIVPAVLTSAAETVTTVTTGYLAAAEAPEEPKTVAANEPEVPAAVPTSIFG